MTNITYRIAQQSDIDSVFNYECNKNFQQDVEIIENQIKVWNSHYRKEALEHYFKLGWSFLAVRGEKEVCGFFMGQPLLFVERQTQTLWVEYVSADSNEIYTELIDIAYRLSREKHFQRVLFATIPEEKKLIKPFPFEQLPQIPVFLKTTK